MIGSQLPRYLTSLVFSQAVLTGQQVTSLHPFFDLAYSDGGPVASAKLRQQPEDFQVTELIDLDLSGVGEHLWVRVRKQGLTTQELAGELARWAKVRPNAVGYSGMKDKYAVTEQWFSITLPGRDDPEPATASKWHITEQSRHSKKLKRGFHSGNHFQIRLRELDGQPAQVEQRLQHLKQQGCPNYFGDQRFGRDGDNVESALAMFNGSRRVKQRHLKGVLISAARSHLFNQLLAQRVGQGSWQTAQPGDVMMLAGSRSFFVADEIDETIQQRLASGDVLISGPLWGAGESPAGAEIGKLENQLSVDFSEICSGLDAAGLRQERRSLQLDLADLQWGWQEQDLIVEFSLPSGAFATSVLREIADWRAPAQGQ